jgi:hypothetical protein
MISEGTTTVAFRQQVPGAQFAHILNLEFEKVNNAQTLPIWRRFFCHALISTLPEEALSEVQERIVEIFEDCSQRKASSHDIVSTFPRVFMAQQGRHDPRPEVELED